MYVPDKLSEYLEKEEARWKRAFDRARERERLARHMYPNEQEDDAMVSQMLPEEPPAGGIFDRRTLCHY